MRAPRRSSTNGWPRSPKSSPRHDAANPERPAAPFAVNQIVHKSNTRLQHDLGMCVKYKVPIVITSLGAVEEVNQAIHSYGGIVLHDVIHDRHARKAIEKGADGLIAVATGAGGHAGTLSPFALVQEIRQWFDGPLLLSGAIANGGAVLAAQAMGADMAYIGSPFIATTEARAVDEYKAMIVESKAADIVYSNLFTGVHGNYLKGSIRAQGMDPDNLPVSDPSKMELRVERGEGVEAYLGLRPGHRRGDGGGAGGRAGRAAGGRIRRGEEAHLRGIGDPRGGARRRQIRKPRLRA